MKDLLEIGNALQNQNFHESAMVTVVQVEGSAYRRAGARMLIAPDGRTCGMISGGCLEHDVLGHARGVMSSGKSRLLRYDSTSADDLIFGTGLGCNGVIDVLVEPLTPMFRQSLVATLGTVQQTRESGGLATMIHGPAEALSSAHAFFNGAEWTGDRAVMSFLETQVFPNDEEWFAASARTDNTRIFIQKLSAPLHVVIFGGWLDVVPVVRFAQQIGCRVSVVDACRRASSEKYFADANAVLLCSPEEAVARLPLDERTVVLLMNHNFERDQAALAALTEVAVPYIGMLGPKRRQQKILQALEADEISVSEQFKQTLHGPVGLDIGAKTPDEIALAIMAEILATLNGRDAKPVRDRVMPLHVNPTPLVYA